LIPWQRFKTHLNIKSVKEKHKRFISIEIKKRRRKMKKLTTLTLITLTAITFNSCGAESCATAQVLAIDAVCNANNDITDYTLLQTGDIISKDEDNTTINILHNQENEKFACVESGSASVIRAI
jgi:hypothetical protein